MICNLLLICFVVILYITKKILNQKYGKISDISLRRKIIDDSTNLILFSIVFWCLINTYSGNLPLISLLIIATSLFLFLHRNWFRKKFWLFIEKVRQKIAFSIKLDEHIKRCLKNWEISIHNDEPPATPNNSVYREHISLAIIYFCKSAIILAIALMAIIAIIKDTDTETYDILLKNSEMYMDTFSDLFVLINNVGLVFTCWKFRYDYVASISEKNDDPRYLSLVRRMIRNEHEI